MKNRPRCRARLRVLATATALAAASPLPVMAQAGIPYSITNVAEPIQTVAGVNIGSTNGAPGVQVLDDLDNPVTNTPVTVSVSANSFAGGTTNLFTDTNGIVRFTNLVLTKAQSGYRLIFAASNSITSTSAPFPVVPAAPDFAQVTTQPSSSNVYGSPVGGFPTVTVYDIFTNAIRNGTGIRVTISSNGFRAGSATNLSTDPNGQVVFSNLVPAAVGTGYTLTFDTQAAGVDNTNSASFNVSPRELTIGGTFTASSRAYNGSNNATISSSNLTLLTPVTNDIVSLNAIATFPQTTVGTNLVVSLTGSTLTGASAGNYTLNTSGAPTAQATISNKFLSITGSFGVSNRVYDGTTEAGITPNNLGLSGVVAADSAVVQLVPAANFNRATVGSGIPVALSTNATYLTNTNGVSTVYTNYALNFSNAPSTNGTISNRPAFLSGSFTSTNKVYDNTSNAAIVASNLLVLSNVLTNDAASVGYTAAAFFPRSTVGTNLAVTLSTNTNVTSLTGLGGSTVYTNYALVLTNISPTTNDITPRPVTITGSFGVSNRPYNASNNATISSDALALSNVLAADTNSVQLQAVATFNPFTVGTNTAFLTNSFLTNRPSTGTAYTNYVLVTSNAPTSSGVILGRVVTIGGSFVATNKVYNGSNNASISTNLLTLVGLQGGDTNSVSLNAVGAFAQPTVGTNITVTLSDSTLTGSNAANYNLSLAGAPTNTANITPATLTIDGSFAVANKTYDGTNTGNITANNLDLLTPAPVDQGDTNKLRLVAAAAFSQAGVGTNLTVTLSNGSSLAGTSATNYALSFSNAPTNTANITARAAFITGFFGVSNKIYDASNNAVIASNGLRLSNLVTADTNFVQLVAQALFSQVTVGTNIPVTLSTNAASTYLTNTNGVSTVYLNYALSFSNAPSTNGAISNRPAFLSGSFTSTNKVYDNTSNAAIVSSNLVLSNVMPSDTNSVGYFATAFFSQATVGTNLPVRVSTNTNFTYLTNIGTNTVFTNYAMFVTNVAATTNSITRRDLTLFVSNSTVKAGQSTNDLTPKPAITESNLATNDTIALVVGPNTNYTSLVLASTNPNRTVAGIYSNDLGVLTSGTKASNYTITTNLGTLTITASNASVFSIVADPIQTTAGAILPGLNLTNASNMPPAVRVSDTFGNIVTNFTVGVGLSTNGFFSGATNVATDTNGVAVFSNLVITNSGVGYFLNYTGSGITNAPLQSEQFSVIAAAAAGVNIVQDPLEPTPPSPPQSWALAGDNLIPAPRVQVVDRFNNPVLTGPYSISVSVSPSATVFGPTVQTNSSADGTATFAGLSIRRAGLYSNMVFTPAGAGLQPTNSTPFIISANTNSAILSIATQPSNSMAGNPIAPNPVLVVQDQFNNPITNQSVAAALTQNSSAASYATNSTTAAFTGTNGRVTFSNLVINQANTNYAAVFSLPYLPTFGTGSVTSVTFNVTPAALGGFSFAPILPSNKVAGLAFPVTITAIDRFTNTVTDFTNQVSLSLNTNSLAAGSPAGPFVAGVLSNHNVTINVTNPSYRLTAAFVSGTNTNSGQSSLFSVGAAVAASVRLTGPTNVVAGVVSSNFTLTAYDQFTNVAAVTTTTRFSLATSQASGTATFNPTNVTILSNASSGTFTYRNTTVGTTNHDLTATYASGDAGLTNDSAQATIAVVPGPAAGLVMVTNPSSNAAAGIVFSQQPAVRLVDQFTNNVSQSNVTVNASIAAGQPALEGVTNFATTTSGVATFTNLAIGGVPGARTLRFAATNFAGTVTSTVVNVSVGPAARISMVEEPSQVPAGFRITNATTGKTPTVRVTDKYTNVIGSQAVTVALTPTNSFAAGSVTNATTGTNGDASFTNLVVTNAFSPYQLAFRAGDATNESRQFAVVAGAPTEMRVATQPGTSIAGQRVSGPPSAFLLDSFGNPVNDTTITALLRLGTNSSSFAAGSTNSGVSGTNGRVVFSNLTITQAATNYSIFFDTGVAGYPGTNTAAFIVLPDLTNARITVTNQPGNSVAGSNIPGPATVLVRDPYSNNVVDQPVLVTLNTNSFIVGSSNNVSTGSNGTVAFTNLSIGPAGTNYQMRFTLQNFTNVTTNSTVFTNIPAAAAKLVITQQPPATNQAGKVFVTSPVVRLQDSFNNNTTNSGVQILASLGSGSAALIGTTNVATTGGSASFSNLRIDGTVGVRTLSFTSTGLASIVSSNVTITAGDLASLSIVTQPVRTIAGEPILGLGGASLQVRARDAFTNNVPGISVTPSAEGFFFAGASAPANTDSNGIASFGTLSTTEAGINYRIAFASGAFSTNSALFNVIPASPESLEILQQPFGGVVGSVLAPNPSVQLTDRFGNPTTVATPYNIGVRMTNSTFTGGSTTSVMTGTEGKATFTNLIPATSGSNVVLEFDIDGAPVAKSDQFNIIGTNQFQPSEVKFVSLTGSEEDLEVGATRALTATLLNAAGQTVTNSSTNVTFAAIPGTGGSLSGLTNVPATRGVATNIVTGATAGAVAVRASVGAIASEPLSFTVTGVELAILRIERTTSDPAAFAIVPQSADGDVSVQSAPGEPVVQITFKVNPKHNFTVWKAPSLAGAWTAQLQGTAQEIETIVELPVAPEEGNAFYRISAEPASE